MNTYQQAEIAVSLMALKFTTAESLEASKNCHDLDSAIAYLQQDCELCAGKYPAHEVRYCNFACRSKGLKNLILDCLYAEMYSSMLSRMCQKLFHSASYG